MKMKLSDINLLDELNRPELRALREKFTERRVPRGSLVFSPYEAENLVFLVASGRLRVYLACDDKEFTLSTLGRGDIYTTHTRAWVQAVDDAALLTAPLEVLRRSLTELPGLTETMMKVLGDILGSAFSIINALAFKDIPDRIAELLAGEACRSGEATPEGTVVRLGLTTEQIARIVGGSRQTVSTALSEFERRGLIRRRGRGEFLISNSEGLIPEADNHA